jgi:hypothetical protein
MEMESFYVQICTYFFSNDMVMSHECSSKCAYNFLPFEFIVSLDSRFFKHIHDTYYPPFLVFIWDFFNTLN